MPKKFIHVAAPSVGQEEVEAVRRVLLSGQYVSGPKVKEFEQRFAEYIGTSHAVAVNSGTVALHIAMEALGVGQGDEVIVPPLTFFATVSSVLYLRAVPVFADIDPTDLCLSPQSVARCITPRTKAIMPVHLFGAAAKMDALGEIARDYGVWLVEDCAQAHGSEYKKQKVGSMGHAGAFSFFATKHMTTGEGGMITMSDPELAEKCRIIRNHGMTDRDTHLRLGFNSRMTEMEAALGLVQLKKLDELNQKRIKNSKFIIRHLKKLPWAKIPVPGRNVKHTFFWCPVMVEKNSGKTIAKLKAHLKKHRIGFRHRYAQPLYRQPVLQSLGLDYSDLKLPNVEKVVGQVLGLPNHPGLTKDDLQRIVDVLTAF